MSEPIANPSPKARFLESNVNISDHRKMVDSVAFQRACDFATLEYTALISNQNRDMNACAGTALKLQGALEFLQTFRLLSEKPLPPVSRVLTPDNLNHAVQ